MFVFENLVAFCQQPAQERVACRLRRWKTAVNMWELDGLAVKHLWDLQWRYNYRLDCVTFKSEQFAEALRDKFDRNYIPFSNVFSETVYGLSRRLSSMPDVVRVFDPDPNRMLTWGSKGKYVSSSTGFQPLS